jgi:hypothetical protein
MTAPLAYGGHAHVTSLISNCINMGLANRTSPTIPTVSERQFMAFACARVVHYAGSALSLLVIRAKSWLSTSMCSTTGSTSTVPFA